MPAAMGLSAAPAIRAADRVAKAKQYVWTDQGVRFQDAAVQQRIQQTLRQLVLAATSPQPSTNNCIARKVLRYRNVLDRPASV